MTTEEIKLDTTNTPIKLAISNLTLKIIDTSDEIMGDSVLVLSPKLFSLLSSRLYFLNNYKIANQHL